MIRSQWMAGRFIILTLKVGTTLSLCPSRIVNPTYMPASPLPTNYMWGCPPGHLCHPGKSPGDGNCNFEVGPPANTYFCRPDECIPSPQLLPAQFWNHSPDSDQIGTFNVSPGYFNLNPRNFSLDYNVFQFPLGITLSPRESSIRLPGKCYDVCNDANLEAQSRGKTKELCQMGSEFQTYITLCMQCIRPKTQIKASITLLPDFEQVLFYCDSLDTRDSSTRADTIASTPTQTTERTSNVTWVDTMASTTDQTTQRTSDSDTIASTPLSQTMASTPTESTSNSKPAPDSAATQGRISYTKPKIFTDSNFSTANIRTSVVVVSWLTDISVSPQTSHPRSTAASIDRPPAPSTTSNTASATAILPIILFKVLLFGFTISADLNVSC